MEASINLFPPLKKSLNNTEKQLKRVNNGDNKRLIGQVAIAFEE